MIVNDTEEPQEVAAEKRTLFGEILDLENMVTSIESTLIAVPIKQTDTPNIPNIPNIPNEPTPGGLIILSRNRIQDITKRLEIVGEELSNVG